MQTEFDYIVVGAGSAGAIVAARLAENDSANVLLLEAGPKDRSPLLHVPAAMRHAYNAPKYNWSYETEPEPFLNSRTLVQPRGKVLGGSSSINGLLYLRGHPLDYDGWAEAGAKGWSYAEVLPYFQRLETRADGNSEYQGRKGRIGVSTMGGDHPLTRAFL
ncbi:MAG: GMC family oxidoreductase N-terminal domain-containing protein, partial [Boseongicola sp.]|nr:GMC family oxidoreductase N-terminal domain-containing protein [Boseongicola sp.]